MAKDNAVLARNTEMAAKNPLYSQTVAFSHYNNFSAQLPIDPKTDKIVPGGIKAQAEQCFKNIAAILESINHVRNDIVKITIFLTNIKDIDTVNEVYKNFFTSYLPAQSIVVVAALPMNALLQVEALVSNGEGSIPGAPQAGDLIKLVNNTEKAPLCPLSSQTVSFSHYNHLSAQLPIDPKTGRVISGDLKEQTRQCLKNIKAILESIDVPFDDIVKINIFLTNLADAKAADEVYCEFFPDSAIARAAAYLPARTIVEASALPMNALIQIEAVVSHGDGTPPQLIEDRHGIVIKANNSKEAPIDPLSTQSVAFSHYNHLSAQLPIDPKTGKLIAADVKKQAEQCLNNIQSIVESINHSMKDIVKVNIFLKNIEDLATFDEVYKNFFPDALPARRLVAVSALPLDALIQIDAIVANAEGTAPKA